MKYRQAKKLVKKHPIIKLWCESCYQWRVACSTHRTNDYNRTFFFYVWWDWQKMLKESHKFGISSKMMKLYTHKTYDRNFVSQYPHSLVIYNLLKENMQEIPYYKF